MKSLKRSLAVLCTIFICSACGQAEPPAPAETTSAETVTSAETSTEVTTTAETTTEAQTEETTVSTIVVTTVEVKPETEVTAETTTEATEATTETKEVDRSSLPSEIMLDVQRNGKENSSIIASVLVYYGIDCTSDDIAGADDVAFKDVDGMISVINSFFESKGGGYEAVDMSGYTMPDIAAEIVDGNPVLYWADGNFGAFYGYELDTNVLSGESDEFYYSSNKMQGSVPVSAFYKDKALPIGCPAIVIRKK